MEPKYEELSVGELDEIIMKLEDELEKKPTKETYDRMIMLMKISNKKRNKSIWNVKS